MSWLQTLWYDDGRAARVARATLAPASCVYRMVVRARNFGYDASWLPTHGAALPAVSVGNATVGGTGKTPVAAYFASYFRTHGAAPAVVLRGYGGDEPRVHQILNPGIPVIPDADRVRGIRSAKAAGCDVVVLDDAFQHRRVSRAADVVLVSAEQWNGADRMLPAGPWREPLASLRRASVVVVTRKSAGLDKARSVCRALEQVAGIAAAVAHLELCEAHLVGGSERRVLDSMAGMQILAAAGIGNPATFALQLRSAGMTADLKAYPDHHAYTAADVDDLARTAARYDAVVCTLKDAVKLASLWPRSAPPLWYVSQRVNLDAGAAKVFTALDRVLDARSSTT